jgi:hypothetical protein
MDVGERRSSLGIHSMNLAWTVRIAMGHYQRVRDTGAATILVGNGRAVPTTTGGLHFTMEQVPEKERNEVSSVVVSDV